MSLMSYICFNIGTFFITDFLIGKPIEQIDPDVDMDASINEDDGETVAKGEPTNYKDLDPKTMKVGTRLSFI